MADVTVQQMAARVAQLMEDRLNVRGTTLPEKLRRGGRRLPRGVRTQAAYLAEAAEKAQIPKLQLQLDHKRIASAYDRCVKHLRPIGMGARRRAYAMSVLSSAGLAVFATGALFLAFLVWRGLV